MSKMVYVLLAAVAALLSAAGAYGQETVSYPDDIVYTEPVKAVVFSHKDHLARKGIVCDTCHSKLFKPEALAAYKKGDFVMKSFYACNQYCGGCHNGKVAFSATTECARCHAGMKMYKEDEARGVVARRPVRGPAADILFGSGRNTATFQHAAHAKLKCSDCHTAVFPMKMEKIDISMASINSGKFCGHCHNGKVAFAISSGDCVRCHVNGARDGGIIAYAGGGTGKVFFSHDRHLKSGLKCDQCHSRIFGFKKSSGKITMDMINGGKACGTCHNGKKAFASDDCTKCHQTT